MVSRHDTDMEGRNPLDYAQDIGWEEGAEYLARYGFAESDRRMVDNHQTRIEKIMRDCFGVIGEDRSEFLRAALALGGDPDMMARPSLSLFHQAVVELSMPMAQALLEAGADISRLSARGETTLQVLWWCHAPKPLSDDWHAMARLLREHGADTTDFKLPDEMTAVELTHPLKGAIAGARGMDYALAAKRYDLYRKALIHLGPEKAAAELTRHCGLVQSRPLDSLCFNDTLGEVFTAEVWSGGTAHMRAAWATVAEQAAQPSRFRDDKPCRFTAEDFSAVTAQMDRQALARQRPRHLKL
jgi:hypothetical protein